MLEIMAIVAAVLHGALYAGALVGSWLILRAGTREARGDCTAARRLARRGGFTMAGATLATVASWPAVIALLPQPVKQAWLHDSPIATVVLAGGMVGTVFAGFVGLLAGLSAKPRPTGYFAAALLVAVLTGLLLVFAGAFD